jgi:hypothetical protein
MLGAPSFEVSAAVEVAGSAGFVASAGAVLWSAAFESSFF